MAETGGGEAIVQGQCVTLRLTTAQRETVRAATGKTIEALNMPVSELEERATDATGLSERDEALVWECLNPYP